MSAASAFERPATHAAWRRAISTAPGRRSREAVAGGERITQSGALGQTDGLVQAEERQVAVRADRRAVAGGEPGLRGVLDQHQTALVAPPAPAGRVLWKALIVDEVERPRASAEQSVELRFGRFEALVAFVEATLHATPGDRLDLGAVVVGRHQDLVPGDQAEPLDTVPHGVAGPGAQAPARVVKRVGEPAARPPEPDIRREGRPRADSGGPQRDPTQ